MSLFPIKIGLLAALLVLTTAPAVAQEEFRNLDYRPPGMLEKNIQIFLPLEPIALSNNSDAVFVVGKDKDHGSIVRLNPITLVEESRADLPFVPLAINAAQDGSRLLVAGTRNLIIMDTYLRITHQQVVSKPLQAPSIYIAKDGLILLADAASGGYTQTLIILDETLKELQPNRFGGMIAAASGWIDIRNKVVFLNDLSSSALILASLEGEISQYFRPTETIGRAAPLIVDGVTSDSECALWNETNFLLYDASNDLLTFATYDPLFNWLNVRTSVPAPLPPQSKYSQATSTNMLSSSCNRQVILIGRHSAHKLLQYAVNPGLDALEKIGEIPLEGLPKHILVSDDAQSAYIILSNSRSLMRFVPGNELFGEMKVRALQRHLIGAGYTSGVIDGIEGVQTLRARELFDKETLIQEIGRPPSPFPLR